MKSSKRTGLQWISSGFLIAALVFSPVCSSRALADDTSAAPASGAADGSAAQIKQIAGGKGFAVVLKTDGTVWSWGDNLRGKLGGGLDSRSKPSQVKGISDVIAIAVGEYHTLALKKDGTVWSWGQNSSGQLGDGTTADHAAPEQVAGLSDITAISAGFSHSVALKSDGTVWSWGDDSYSQLGDGKQDNETHPVKAINIQNAKAIAAGAYHTVALDADSYVWGWGDNSMGELGNGISGSTYNSPTMAGGLNHVTQIAAGYNFTMALTDNSGLWTWGDNSQGQLGLGTSAGTAVTLPSAVQGSQNIVAIAAENLHALSLDKDGTVRAWGDNSSGQLGSGTAPDGNTYDNVFPGIVNGLPKAAVIGTGFNFSFVVGADNTLWAMGNNAYGQLGDGTKQNQLVPEQITSFAAAAAPTLKPGEGPVINGSVRSSPLAAGDSTTFVVKNGKLFGWGDNLFGQLGTGGNTGTLAPQALTAVTDVAAVAEGGSHTAVVKKDGSLWTWGNNFFGQLGNGTTTSSNAPVQVNGLQGVVSVAAGSNHTIVLLNNGTVWGFGDNTFGQLGVDDNNANSETAPTIIPSLTHITAIAAGGNYSLALQDNGTVWAWGDNSNGQLGDGTNSGKNQPVQVLNLQDIRAIAAGKNHALALKSDGTVWTWGYNGFGQLGNGNQTSQNTPEPIGTINDAIAIAAGAYHSLAIRANGTVWTWGFNQFGQLGDGTTANQPAPVQVKGLADVSAVAAGSSHSVALKKDGTVWTWGANYNGQLGDGTRTNRSAAQLTTGFVPMFSDIAAHWAKASILQAAEKGYVDGYGDGTFRPDNDVTRAEFVKMLAASLQLQTAAAGDGQAWYQPYADALAKKGMLQTGDLQADWNQPITRQEMALLSIRTAETKLQQPNSAAAPSFIMSEAVKTGLIQGLAGGELAPDGFTTRAQAVTVIERIATVLQGGTLPVDQQALQRIQGGA